MEEFSSFNFSLSVLSLPFLLHNYSFPFRFISSIRLDAAGWYEPAYLHLFTHTHTSLDSRMAHSCLFSHDAYLSFVLNSLLVDIIYFIIWFFNSFSTSIASRPYMGSELLH